MCVCDTRSFFAPQRLVPDSVTSMPLRSIFDMFRSSDASEEGDAPRKDASEEGDAPRKVKNTRKEKSKILKEKLSDPKSSKEEKSGKQESSQEPGKEPKTKKEKSGKEPKSSEPIPLPYETSGKGKSSKEKSSKGKSSKEKSSKSKKKSKQSKKSKKQVKKKKSRQEPSSSDSLGPRDQPSSSDSEQAIIKNEVQREVQRVQAIIKKGESSAKVKSGEAPTRPYALAQTNPLPKMRPGPNKSPPPITTAPISTCALSIFLGGSNLRNYSHPDPRRAWKGMLKYAP